MKESRGGGGQTTVLLLSANPSATLAETGLWLAWAVVG